MNKAVAGRSARSYWNEGKFAALADLVVAGDYVLLYVFNDSLFFFIDKHALIQSSASLATTMEAL